MGRNDIGLPYRNLLITAILAGLGLTAMVSHAVTSSHDYTAGIITKNEKLNGTTLSGLRQHLMASGFLADEPTSPTAKPVLNTGDVIVAGTLLSGIVNPGGLIDFLDTPSSGTLNKPVPFAQLVTTPDFRPDSTLDQFVTAARKYYKAGSAFQLRVWRIPRKITQVKGDTTLGAQVGKPFFIGATNPNVTDSGIVLENAATYIIQTQGTYSNRSGTPNCRDALYQFLDSSGKPIEAQRHHFLAFFNPTGSYLELSRAQPGGRQSYNKEHVYEVAVIGEGKTLKGFIKDGQHGDNSGGFTVRVFRALGSNSAPD